MVAGRPGDFSASSGWRRHGFHLAAPRRIYNKATRTTQRVGGVGLTEGTIRLAAIVAASDVARMIVSSSAAVYGKPWGEFDETSPAAPVSDYGRERAYMQTCSGISGLPGRLIIARLTETFGPGSPGELGILTSIAEGRFRLIGDGRVLHHLSTVDDTAAGLLALARTEAAGGSVLHIGSRPRTLRDFVSAASEALGQPLRATPWAGPPAQAALQLLRSAPALSRRAAALHAMLDYQLRPRAFSIDRSLALLGDYATCDFERVVAESAGRSSGRPGGSFGGERPGVSRFVHHEFLVVLLLDVHRPHVVVARRRCSRPTACAVIIEWSWLLYLCMPLRPVGWTFGAVAAIHSRSTATLSL